MAQKPFESLLNKYELSQNSVHSIWQDEFGVMWFANDVGLDYFDGNRLVKNSIKFPQDSKLLRYKASRLGALRKGDNYHLAFHASNDSILYYTQFDREWQMYEQQLPDEKEFYAQRRLKTFNIGERILNFSDSLVYGADYYYQFEDAQKMEYPIADKVLHVTIDPITLNPYYITQDSVFQINQFTGEVNRAVFHGKKFQDITAVAAYQNIVYLGTDNLQVWQIKMDNAEIRNLLYGSFQIPCKSKITDIAIERSGKLWASTRECGLYCINLETKEYLIYQRENEDSPISRNAVLDVFVSSDQSVWLGMNEGGVDQLVNQEGINFNQEFLNQKTYYKKSNSVSAILAINDSILWLSTEGNVIQEYNTNQDVLDSRMLLSKRDDLKNFHIYSFAHDGTFIYVGTNHGLYKYQFGRFEPMGFVDKTVYRLKYIEETNSLICGLNNTALEADGGLYSIKLTDTIKIDTIRSNENVQSIAYDPAQQILFAGTRNGLIKFYSDGREEKSLDTLSVISLLINEQGTWIGTDKNGLLLDREGEEPTAIGPAISNEPGAGSKRVYNITDDTEGNIWFSTNAGMFQYFPKRKSFINYTIEEGLNSNEFNYGAFAKSDNFAFFGGINGVNSFNYKRTKTSDIEEYYVCKSSLQLVYFRTSERLDKTIWEDSLYLILPNEFKSLSITPVIDNFNKFSKNNIRYRLANEKNDYQAQGWIYASDRVTLLEFDLIRPAFLWDIFQPSSGKLEIEISNGKSDQWIRKVIDYKVRWSSKEHVGFLLLSLLILGLLYLWSRWHRLWRAEQGRRKRDKAIQASDQEKSEKEKAYMEEVISELKMTQEVINQISRLDNTIELRNMACQHFQDIFKFEYGIISIVNVFTRKIESLINFSENRKKVDPEKWKSISNYDLDKTESVGKDTLAAESPENREDILVKICRCKVKDPIIVIGDYVVQNSYGITFDNINPECFEKGHENLARVFIPIIHRSKSQDESYFQSRKKAKDNQDSKANADAAAKDDFEIGVVELGFYVPKIPTLADKSSLLDLFPAEILANLGLYIDNFSQPYYRSMLAELESELLGEMQEINKNNSGHIEFMESGLKYVVDKFKGSYGSFAPVKLNAFPLFLGEAENVLYNYTKDDLMNVEEINAIIAENFENYDVDTINKIGLTNLALLKKKPIWVNDIFQSVDDIEANEEIEDKYSTSDKEGTQEIGDNSYLPMLADIQAELSIPLLSSGGVPLGVLLISSDKEDFFNKIHIWLYENLAKELARVFTNKKRLGLTQLISSPFDIFGMDTNLLFSPVLDVFSKHLYTEDICLWELAGHIQNETGKRYVLGNYSSSINAKLEDSLLTELKIDQDFYEKETYKIETNKNIPSNVMIHKVKASSEDRFDIFCEREKYLSVLILQVPVHRGKDYLITVFSKKEITIDEIIENSEEIMLSIIDKMQSSFRLFSFTQILTQTKFDEESGIDRVIEVLAETAFHALNATIVGIILCDPETNEILLDQSHIKHDIDLPFEDDPAILSEAIMQDHKPDNNWYFFTKEGYIRYLAKIFGDKNFELNEDSLLSIADINSLAAIKLTDGDKVLGTLMVEYEEPGEVKNWTTEIENFKRIAERLLKIDYDFKMKSSEMLQLNTESELIKEQIVNLNIEKVATEEKYVEAYEKMEELLPRAAGISYFLLVMAVKHDIRNFLRRLNTLLEESLEVFEASKNKAILKDYNAVLRDCDLYVNKIADLIELFDFRNVVNVPIHINSIIRDLVQLFKGLKDYQVILELDKNVDTILGPKSRMSMILYNLMNNAIDAIEDKKEKHPRANIQGKILIKSWTEKNFYFISIRDNGVGIHGDKMEWIFLPGKTTKTKKNLGIGIGLFFVKTALNDYFSGAEIRPQSEFGKYAEFILKIPKNANQGN